MLYPAELGARRTAIQVGGERAVKRKAAWARWCGVFPVPPCLVYWRDCERRAGEPRALLSAQHSAGEVETPDPSALATLNRAARDFTEQVLVFGR
jgi:hypothetical protein